MASGTQFPDTLVPDAPTVIDAAYRFTNADRAKIDAQITGTQGVVASLSAQIASATKSTATVSGSLSKGNAIVTSGGDVKVASSTNLTGVLVHAGLAISDVVDNTVTVVTQGLVDPTIVDVGAGAACAVGTNAGGNPVRVTDPTCVSGLKFLGVCDADGAIYVNPTTSPTVDIRQFGAACDNSTDDSTAINAALASGAARVVMPGLAIHIASTINVHEGVVLEGAGAATVLNYSGSGDAMFAVPVSPSADMNSCLKNFYIQSATAAVGLHISNTYVFRVVSVFILGTGTGSSFTTAGVHIGSDSGSNLGPTHLTGCHVQQCVGDGILCDGPNPIGGLYITEGNRIQGNGGKGIRITQSAVISETKIENNDIEGNIEGGIEGNFYACLIHGNHLEQSTSSTGPLISCTGANAFFGLRITSNNFVNVGATTGATDYGIVLLPGANSTGVIIEGNTFFETYNIAAVNAGVGGSYAISGLRWAGNFSNAPKPIDFDGNLFALDYQDGNGGSTWVRSADVSTSITADPLIDSYRCGNGTYEIILQLSSLFGGGGKRVIFKNVASQLGQVTIRAASGDNIDGGPAFLLIGAGSFVEIENDGAASWSVIREFSTAPFTPASLSGLVLWLDAAQGITLSTANVTTWADQSGAGFDMNAQDAVNTYSASGGPNSLPCITFALGALYRANPLIMGNDAARTAFTIAKTTVTATYQYVWHDGDDSINTGTGYQNNGTGSSTREIGVPGRGTCVDASSLTTGWEQTCLINTGALAQRFREGEAEHTITNDNLNPHGAVNTFGIGGTHSRPSSPFVGSIAEHIHYNRLLTASEIVKVEAYLLGKYGV